MHEEILTKEQSEILPALKEFSKDFGMVGGTAIAFHLGHRRSIDFDLFSREEFGNQSILRKITRNLKIDRVIVNKLDELTVLIKEVKITFFHYRYEVAYSENVLDVLKMPDLLTLAAMKAFALGMRSKWKDYVDLYFIIKKYFSTGEIAQKAAKIFGNEFNEKLFRTQLAYFEDINYSEAIIFMPGFETSDEKIKQELIEFSLR